MDNISVPSRFSCLKIEDEDFNPAPTKTKKKSDNSKQIVKKNTNLTQINNLKKTLPKQVYFYIQVKCYLFILKF